MRQPKASRPPIPACQRDEAATKECCAGLWLACAQCGGVDMAGIVPNKNNDATSEVLLSKGEEAWLAGRRDEWGGRH